MDRFIKLNATYSAKNKLQQEALKLSGSYDRRLLFEDELLKLNDEITKDVDALNRSYPRCQPLKVNSWINHHSDGDVVISVGDLFSMIVYKCKPYIAL